MPLAFVLLLGWAGLIVGAEANNRPGISGHFVPVNGALIYALGMLAHPLASNRVIRGSQSQNFWLDSTASKLVKTSLKFWSLLISV